MRILIIAPHPDDEVLGCGGTIKKHSQKGDEVYLCIVTKGYTPDWSQEYMDKVERGLEESSKILGIKDTFFLGFPTAKLDTVPQKELNDSISKCLDKVKPEVLYIPFDGDASADHRLTFEAVMVAARPLLKSKIKKILCYEVLSETDFALSFSEKPFLPNVYIDIFDTLDEKLKAMSCYKTELKNFPHPRSLEGIKILAEKRGGEVGIRSAEAFKLIRHIVN